MDEKAMVASGIRYFQREAKEFTPITVSCDFAALQRPEGPKSCTEALGKVGMPGEKHKSPNGEVLQGRRTTHRKKEKAMNENTMIECGICYFQGMAKAFTPTTAGADLEAYECPKCLNNHSDCFEELQTAQAVKAA